jgi:hypothetical protein
MATEEMTKSYLDVALKYEKIKVPKQGDYEPEQLNKEDNDEFNELWDEFRDTRKTLH